VTGPSSRRAGEVAGYSVEVKNNGSSPVSNVVLCVTWGANLELIEASRGHEDELPRQTTRWRIAELSGGETTTWHLNCLCRDADEQGASVRATVSSQQTATVANQTATRIAPRANAAPRAAPIPVNAVPIRP
jgi:uncharacterized repeat protein (TIGR01451 family)